MLNHIVLMGRLTADPELRRTGNGTAVATFALAVDRDFGSKANGDKEVDFIDCVAWRGTAEFISKYFSKGRMMAVSGRLQVRTWDGNNGIKHRATEVVVDSAYFADSPKASGGVGYNTDQGYFMDEGCGLPWNEQEDRR